MNKNYTQRRLEEFDELISPMNKFFTDTEKALDLPNDYSFNLVLKEFLATSITEAVEEERKNKSNWVVHQVHEESGKTTDGKKLYWAKVSNLITPQEK